MLRAYGRIALRFFELWVWTVLFLSVLSTPLVLTVRRLASREMRARLFSSAPLFDSPWWLPLAAVAVIAALLATRITMSRDGVSWEIAGLRRERALRDTSIGLGIGLASFALVPLTAAAFGWGRLTGERLDTRIVPGLLTAFITFLGFSAFEEIMSRGLVFTLMSSRSAAVAISVTSVIFALMHAPNTGFDLLSFVGVCASGAALAVARLRSGALWLPIGWHLGWNFSQGSIFGCSVSGMPSPETAVLVTRLDGPAIAVGGEFGPESGLLATGATLLTLWAYARFSHGSSAGAPARVEATQEVPQRQAEEPIKPGTP